MNEETPAAVAAGASVVRLPRPRAAAEDPPAVTEEQLTYARVLDLGMKIGLLVLVVTFLVYLSGALPPRVPVDDLPSYWSLPVAQYLATTDVQAGWSWVRLLGHGDFLNFIGVAFLSGVTVVCYLAILPSLFRKKDLVYGWLVVVEVAVLVLAASGVLSAGAH